MKTSRLTLAAAASLLLSTPFLLAQAKPSPYEGVSTPPANDSINTTEQAPATQPPAAAPAPAVAPAPAPAAKSNPDAGIIETPLPPSVGDYMPHSAALHPRGFDASADKGNDDDIVTYVPAPANALPAGTVFRVRMLQDIDA